MMLRSLSPLPVLVVSQSKDIRHFVQVQAPNFDGKGTCFTKAIIGENGSIDKGWGHI